MWRYEKRLQYPVNIKTPNPKIAQYIMSQYGGPDLTPVIASHNLRELEDICDHVGLLHKGGMLLSKDLDDMKLNIHKIQCVLPAGVGSSDLQGIDIIKTEQRGSLLTLTVRGKREEIQTILQAYHPVFFEMIPLSLEEIFISETEVAGYDIKRLVF